MPTISKFYGIVIKMNLSQKEHNPPHIHAIYGEQEATFKIFDGKLLKGRFPNKGIALVKEFILLHKKELEEMWETATYKQLPPLE